MTDGLIVPTMEDGSRTPPVPDDGDGIGLTVIAVVIFLVFAEPDLQHWIWTIPATEILRRIVKRYRKVRIARFFWRAFHIYQGLRGRNIREKPTAMQHVDFDSAPEPAEFHVILEEAQLDCIRAGMMVSRVTEWKITPVGSNGQTTCQPTRSKAIFTSRMRRTGSKISYPIPWWQRMLREKNPLKVWHNLSKKEHQLREAFEGNLKYHD